jgi:hypothetical protein
LTSSVESEIVEVLVLGNWVYDSVFVHKDLLRERSKSFRALIDDKEPVDTEPVDNSDLVMGRKNHPVIEIQIQARAFKRFARWVYGQPLWVPTQRVVFSQDTVLDDLAAIHDLCWSENGDSTTWDTECIATCLEAITKVLSQTTEVLYDPISCLKGVLQQHDDLPGRSVILKHLVYSERANDGRTKKWLDQYCEEVRHDTGFVQQVCLEFAGKACGELPPSQTAQ